MNKLFLTLTAGFAAGVVAGVLFAPAKGEKTRAVLKDKAADLGGQIDKQYHQEMEKLKHRVDALTKDLREKMESVDISSMTDDKKNM